MTIRDLLIVCPMTAVSLPDPEKEISGVYTGDLLSWVMGRAKPGQILVTIMTNVNVVAVASLLDLSMVILCDGTRPDDAMLLAARQREINVCLTDASAYEVCAQLSRIPL